MNGETTEYCYLDWLLGVVIEEITEEDTGENKKRSKEVTETQPESNTGGNARGIKTDADGLQALRDDPEAIRFQHHSKLLYRCVCFTIANELYNLNFYFTHSLACRTFQNFITKTDPDTLAAISGGKAGDMFKTASSMIGKMSPEEIQKMVQTASSFKGDNPFVSSTSPSGGNGFAPTPDMLKLASDMMSKMSTEERERMFNMASSLKANAPVSTSNRDAEATVPRESSFVGESSSSAPRSGLEPSVASAPPADLQEQMRNQMKDPAMRQVLVYIFYLIRKHKCDSKCVYI